MAVRLFVGNLPYDTTELALRELFASVGQPGRITLPVDRVTGRPRGFAFVEFADRQVADEAIRKFNSQPFRGRTIAVSEARPREEGAGPRPMGGMGGAPAPYRPARLPDESGGTGPRDRSRNFGPPAPPRRQRGGPARRQKFEKGPKGPIRERVGGRVYDVSGEDEEPILIDDFATSAETATEDETEGEQ